MTTYDEPTFIEAKERKKGSKTQLLETQMLTVTNERETENQVAEEQLNNINDGAPKDAWIFKEPNCDCQDPELLQTQSKLLALDSLWPVPSIVPMTQMLLCSLTGLKTLFLTSKNLINYRDKAIFSKMLTWAFDLWAKTEPGSRQSLQ